MLGAQPDPKFVLFRDDPRFPINGVSRLPAGLTLNSVTEYPMFRYTAGGGLATAAAWSPWGFGETLGVVGAGSAPTPTHGSPAMGPLDDSVLFNDGQAYQGSTFANVTTHDLVLEVVFYYRAGGAVANQYICSTRNTGSNPGWSLYLNEAASNLRFYCRDAAGDTYLIESTALTQYVWYHAFIIWDYQGGGTLYINSSATGTSVTGTASAVDSITSAANFTLGDQPSLAAAELNSAIAYLAAWKRISWLDTHLQATVAEQRASLFWGWKPQQARGTSVPTVRTRASNAFVDKIIDGNTKYFQVGQNIPRICSRLDKNGKLLKGYLPETQITNLITYSTVTEANWSKNDTGDTTSTGASSPFGATAEGWIADTTDGQHGRYINASLAASTVYTLWTVAKKGDQWGVLLRDVTQNIGRYFNLTDGTYAGAVGSAPTNSYSVNLGDGWWLVAIVYTSTSTGAHDIRIYPAEANNDIAFAGDGLTENMYVAHIQVEANEYHSSPILTSGGTAIREEDILRFKADDGNIGGVGSNRQIDVRVKTLVPDIDEGVNTIKRLIQFTDGGDSNNNIALHDQNDVLRALMRATGKNNGDLVGGTQMSTGAITQTRLVAQDNDFRIYLDGVLQASDTSCGVPINLDQIDVGVSIADTIQTNTILADIEIYDRVVRNDRIPE